MAINGIQSLGPMALAVVSLTIIVSIGAIVLAQMGPAAYNQVTVDGETQEPSDALPTTFTVNTVKQGVVEDSEKLYLDETGDGANLIQLEKGTDYEVLSYENGEIELKDSSTLSSYNTADGDQIVVDYEYEEESNANTVFDKGSEAVQTFADFFTVIVVIGISAVLFLLLGGVRQAGRNSMA